VAFDNYCRKQHRSYPNYFYTFSGVVLFWNTDIVWLQEWKDRLVFYLRKRNLILSKKNYTNNSRCKGTGAVKEKEKDRICGRFLWRNMHMGDHRPACCYHGSMDTMYSQPRDISPYWSGKNQTKLHGKEIPEARKLSGCILLAPIFMRNRDCRTGYLQNSLLENFHFEEFCDWIQLWWSSVNQLFEVIAVCVN